VCHPFLLEGGRRVGGSSPRESGSGRTLNERAHCRLAFSISNCLLQMPVESFSLRRVEESVLHAQRMITQSRQFCLSGDVTPPTFNPLQKAYYVVFRVMGAGGCEESQRERESSRERELGDRLSFGVYLAVYLLCGKLARISSPHEIGNWPPGQRALLSTDCCAKD